MNLYILRSVISLKMSNCTKFGVVKGGSTFHKICEKHCLEEDLISLKSDLREINVTLSNYIPFRVAISREVKLQMQ